MCVFVCSCVCVAEKLQKNEAFNLCIAGVLTRGPGELRALLVLVVTQHLINQSKQPLTQLTNLTWFFFGGGLI